MGAAAARYSILLVVVHTLEQREFRVGVGASANEALAAAGKSFPFKLFVPGKNSNFPYFCINFSKLNTNHSPLPNKSYGAPSSTSLLLRSTFSPSSEAAGRLLCSSLAALCAFSHSGIPLNIGQ